MTGHDPDGPHHRQRPHARTPARPAAPVPPGRGDGVRESLLRDSLLVMQVEGMHSHVCEEVIVQTVSAISGVLEVEVDFASRGASIIFDNRKVTVHQIVEAVERLGYPCPGHAVGSGGGGAVGGGG